MLLDEREDPLVRSAATEIRRATDRGAALTRQLLAFGRKHDPRVTRIELDRTVAGLARDADARDPRGHPADDRPGGGWPS